MGIDRNDTKYLEAIREDGKNNFWDLTSYNKENLKDCKRWSEERSKVEALRLEANMAQGLADGYFWSFVKDVVIDIRDADAKNGKEIQLTYSKTEQPVEKMVKRLLIIVPSKLELNKYDPIAHFINSNKAKDQTKENNEAKGYFNDCQIIKSEGEDRDPDSKNKWVTEVIMSDKESNEGIIIDIPTTLTSIIMRLKDKSESKDKIDEDQFKNEVDAFGGQIVKRLKEGKELDQYVTVVKMDSLDDNFMKNIKWVNDQLNKKHESMIIVGEQNKAPAK